MTSDIRGMGSDPSIRASRPGKVPEPPQLTPAEAASILHIVDAHNIYRARCGVVLTRHAGDTRSLDWWSHDDGAPQHASGRTSRCRRRRGP
jgi:hypothetical protein